MVYKITFLDFWHLSSGLSAGAKFDSMVVKDKDNLPFVPAKTIKGLLREIAKESTNQDFVNICFGNEGVNSGDCYFRNATLENKTIEEIVKNNLQNELYKEIASTKIGENGIAENGSLREIEVVIPISLYGKIENIPSEFEEDMKNSLKQIKRMGLNRNRGLGRCKIEILGDIK